MPVESAIPITMFHKKSNIYHSSVQFYAIHAPSTGNPLLNYTKKKFFGNNIFPTTRKKNLVCYKTGS